MSEMKCKNTKIGLNITKNRFQKIEFPLDYTEFKTQSFIWMYRKCILLNNNIHTCLIDIGSQQEQSI